MPAADITFVCTADGRVGFGHLRRCLAVAGLVAEQGLRPAFTAELLDSAARALLQQRLPAARLSTLSAPSPLAVVDCMFDPQDPDACDRDFVARVAARHCRTVYVTSAMRVPPDLPVDAVVGHMLDPVERPAWTLHRGLEWAPVAPGAVKWRSHRRDFPETPRRVLVAFGNWADPAGLLLALEALRLTGWTACVQVLLPPALRPHLEAARSRAAGLEVEWLQDVPEVFPLLAGADLLVGSYGNLTFEALAVGVPTIVVAVKPFMAAYAERLAHQGAVVNAGPVGELTPRDLACRLQALSAAERERLSRTGLGLVDGAGLERLARLLAGWARSDLGAPTPRAGAAAAALARPLTS